MPRLATLDGILLLLFYEEHGQHSAPHIHAEYGEHKASFSIATGDTLAGSLPRRQHGKVAVWIERNRAVLDRMWVRASALDTIEDLKPLLT